MARGKAQRRLTVALREKAIETYLVERDEPLPISEIYEHVSGELDDTISREAYYKIVYRMEADGKLERHELPTGRSSFGFKVAPYLSYNLPISREDIEALLERETTPAEVIAHIIDAEALFREARTDVLRQAAADLLDEDPATLFTEMILDKLSVLEKGYALWRSLAPLDRDSAFTVRLEQNLLELKTLLYQRLSIPREVVALNPQAFRQPDRITALYGEHDGAADPDVIGPRPNRQALHQALKARVVGGSFLREIVVLENTLSATQPTKVRVSGSDASMHIGGLNLAAAPHHTLEPEAVFTFNNGVVVAQGLNPVGDPERDQTHSTPFTRSELDWPRSRGLVMSRLLYPDIESDSVYEHAVKTANDVVQMRVEREILRGDAYDLEERRQIPPPQVLFRDGAVSPQSRDFQHYNRFGDFYGDIAAEGIHLQATILKHLLSRSEPERRQIYAGVVKGTQLQTLSIAINWWIGKGSTRKHGKPLDPCWEERARHIQEHAALTQLFAAIPDVREKLRQGVFYTTCAVVRQFPAMTESFYMLSRNGQTWSEYFGARRDELLERFRRGEPSRLIQQAIEDDPYVYLCGHADYVSFYVGHTAGDPAPLVPRYEFITSLRALTDAPQGGMHPKLEEHLGQITSLVEDHVLRIVGALYQFKIDQDQDHNYLTDKKITRLQPRSILRAHEKSKAIGKRLEAEVASAITKKLIELRRLRASAPAAASFRPVTLRQFVDDLRSHDLALPRVDDADEPEPTPGWLDEMD